MSKKICPLLCVAQTLGDYDVEAINCMKKRCGFWNEKYKVCGLRLATNREGLI